MTRSKRFLYGVGWGYLNQFVMAAAGLYLTRFYLGSLGSTLYGLWIVGLQILAYLTLLDLGIIALLPRETAYTAGADRKQLPGLIAETISISCAQAPLLALLSVVGWLCLPASWTSLKGPLSLTFAAFVLSFPMRAYPAVLQGLQDFSFLGKAHFFCWALGTLAAVAGLKIGWGLYALGAGWIVTQGTLFLASYIRLRQAFADDLPKEIPFPTWRLAKGRLAKSVWVTLSQISQVLLVGTEIIVLGSVLGPPAVVVYSCTAKLVQLLANQPLNFTQSALPGLSQLKSSGDLAGIRRVSGTLTLLVLLLSGAIVVVVLAVNSGFVRWWVGPDNYGGHGLTVLLVLTMILRHYATTLVFSLFCFGHEKALALIGIADGIFTLLLSLFLTPWLGLIGPAVASLVGGALLSVPLIGIYLARDLQLTWWDMTRSLSGWFGRFSLLAALATTILWQSSPTGPLALVGLAALMSAAYGLVMIPVIRSSSLMAYFQPVWKRTLAAAGGRAK